MSALFPQSDVALKDLVVEQTRAGNMEAARQTASRIIDSMLQRQAWLQILYTQRNNLGLQSVKETILSLPDSDLWLGSWVHDLVLDTARSRDIDGAKAIVNKLPEDPPPRQFSVIDCDSSGTAGSLSRSGGHVGRSSTGQYLAGFGVGIGHPCDGQPRRPDGSRSYDQPCH